MKGKVLLIHLLALVAISVTVAACSKEAAVRTPVEVNPFDENTITEMIVQNSAKNITVTDATVLPKAITSLSKIKVRELKPDQESILLADGQKMSARSTYTISLRNESHEVKSSAVLLSNEELILVDVKTMKSNSGQLYYVNLDDAETLKYINELYGLVEEESFKELLDKVKAKGINAEMLKTLCNLGLSEQEILNLQADELGRIFALGNPLGGAEFEPDEKQRTELEKVGIDPWMSIVLYNLGYEYEEMLKLTAEEIDFIFPNTELLANLVARGYREQEVQTEAVRKAGKTYKEIIREAMKKPEAEIDWQALAAGYNPPKIDGLLQAIRDSEITGDGSVAITPVIKREFNRMGEDYRFFFMPQVNWYDFKPVAYESTGEALHYILFTWTGQFGTFPEKAPKYEAEARLRKLFAAPNNEYPRLEHKDYPKCVMFDGTAYTLWPESYNDNTMIYDLTDLKVRQDGRYTYYTASCKEYGFEEFLNTQADSLGLDKAAALSKLLETGKISSAPQSRSYTIEFRLESGNIIPQIISLKKDW